MIALIRLAVILLNFGWVYLGDTLPLVAQLAVPVASVLLWALSVKLECNGITHRNRAKIIQKNLWLLLIYYLALVVIILLVGGLFHVSREEGGQVNLELFHTIKNYWKLYLRTGNFESVSNLLGNIIILLPLGVLLPAIFPKLRRAWVTVPILLLVAFGVELLQYVLDAGTADIDDSFLNFLGATLGYALTRGVQILLK